MLIERQVIGKIEVLEDGQIQLRRDNIVERDGVEIARTYHRNVLDPATFDEKMPHPDSRVQSIVSVLWTPEVVAARKEAILVSQEALQTPIAETLPPVSALPSVPLLKTPA